MDVREGPAAVDGKVELAVSQGSRGGGGVGGGGALFGRHFDADACTMRSADHNWTVAIGIAGEMLCWNDKRVCKKICAVAAFKNEEKRYQQ